MTTSLLFLCIKGTMTTLGVAFGGLGIGMILGIGAGIISARRSGNPLLAACVQGYVFIVQGTPLYIQLLIALYGMPLIIGRAVDPLIAGIITIGLNSVAYVAQSSAVALTPLPPANGKQPMYLATHAHKHCGTSFCPKPYAPCCRRLSTKRSLLLKKQASWVLWAW